MQCRTASQKVFGERGECIALQMVASVHETVIGLVFVAIGEGILLGAAYFLPNCLTPSCLGWLPRSRLMIRFAAAIAVGLAALVLLGSGGVGPAIIVVLAGFAVIFLADHFVRPKLIGALQSFRFSGFCLGILGGVESFQLLGHFLGPEIMAALMLLWRELTALAPGMRPACVRISPGKENGCSQKPFIVTQRVRRLPDKDGARQPEASLARVMATSLVKRRQPV